MKHTVAFILILLSIFCICGCSNKPSEPPASSDSLVPYPPEHFNDHVPYDAMFNLEVMNGQFVFQRIATTPCIVYSTVPIIEMSDGVMYNDRHDILTALFGAMNGKDVRTSDSDCEFSSFIYMFDNEREMIPWHYRFALCDCGTVKITNNDELLCTIKLTDAEIKSILSIFNP